MSALDRATWERIESVFFDALECPPAERAALLDRECGDQPVVRAEIEAMLAAHESQGELRGFLTNPERALPELPGLPAGTMVGPYRIEERIGVGGMGEVFRAERADGAYQQTVALKILRPEYSAAGMARLLHAERQILARLEHPGIATILDGGATAEGRPYLVLQYVDGMPITEYCRRHQLDIDQRLRLFLRVCAAVQFAHGRLVVHRDIKPSNILVTAPGEPRLLDFGIARLLEQVPGDETAHTRTAFRLLTPEHAAPEQLRGEPVSTAADVYTLGVLLFELLAGRRPFTVRNSVQLQRAILEEDAPAPSSVCAHKSDARRMRGDLDRIVLVALRKEPERRYASAGQFAEDIERYLGHLPLHAQRDTFRYRARKFVARNRIAVTALLMFLLLISGFSVTLAVQARRLAAERDRAEFQRSSAEAVVGMLTRLFQASNPRVTPGGDTLRVAAFLEQGEGEVEKLKDQPELQARMWRLLGNIHNVRGRYERAHALLERAWRQRSELSGPTDTLTVSTYHELAEVVATWLGPDSARPMFQWSTAQLERQLGKQHPDVASALLDLASVAYDSRERTAILNRALAAQSAGKQDPIARAEALNAEGESMWSNGRPARAAASFQAALHILEQQLPPTHPDRLGVTGNLAAALSELGELERAESLHRAVLDARRRTLGVQHEMTALSEEAVGILLYRQGKLEAAEMMLDSALATLRAVFPLAHWRIGNTMRNVAVVRMARGQVVEGLALLDSAIAQPTDIRHSKTFMIGSRIIPLLTLGRVDEAARTARTVHQALRTDPPARDTYLASSDSWSGIVALVQGNLKEAEAFFASALKLHKATLPPSHPTVAGAACAHAVALVEQNRMAEAGFALRSACPTYLALPLASPVMKERVSRAMQKLRQ